MEEYTPQGHDYDRLAQEHQRALAFIKELQEQLRKQKKEHGKNEWGTDKCVPVESLATPGEATRLACSQGEHGGCKPKDCPTASADALADAKIAEKLADRAARAAKATENRRQLLKKWCGMHGVDAVERFARLGRPEQIRVQRQVLERGDEAFLAAVDAEEGSADG